MSLLELFKAHQPQHVFHHNKLADFFAGFYDAGMGVHMWRELHECMEESTESEEALFMYGKAIEHLVKGESAEYQKASDEASRLSVPVTTPCKEFGKYAIASAEMEAWFVDFWTQDSAFETMT